MPENLPPAQSIRKLESKASKNLKGGTDESLGRARPLVPAERFQVPLPEDSVSRMA